MMGLSVVFLKYPLHKKFKDQPLLLILDYVFVGCVIVCFGYVVIQTEPFFKKLWLKGIYLGDRVSNEHPIDFVVGGVGILLILEATRRSVGITLALLSSVFLIYAGFGQYMPYWLFPHRGFSLQRIISHTFLHAGTFGIALRVMFTYVFLFVLFGAFLERTGATNYILSFVRRIFGDSVGSPAKVAVIASGLMGSLSGSAVANTATTGTFTIPLMRGVGFKPQIAGGVEAAASSGGALVPPIMGAGAYMMLEIVEPSVTYLQIIQAALLPAILYYTALLLIVHFYAKQISNQPNDLAKGDNETEEQVPSELQTEKLPLMQGIVFIVAFLILIGFLLLGSTPFRAVSWSMLAVLILSLFDKQTRIGITGIMKSMESAAHSGVSLIAAASCVGIILGVVTLTGVGTKLPAAIFPLAQTNLILALLLLMVSTIILGMGLPSSVCYLLMAILLGPVLVDLGVVPLAAHFFIFYFGMMSMVTPPVALAAYTAAAIADAGIMKTAFAAFRFAFVGFALPYAFVLRPELLWLNSDGGNPEIWIVLINLSLTLLGTVIFAASISGYVYTRFSIWERAIMLISAIFLFFTTIELSVIWIHAIAILASAGIIYYNRGKGRRNDEEYIQVDSI